ncbi:helix-turn-helix domain-containing protein [Flavobacterium sp. N1994]|uniref:helix-turn-helix domain-containing protein n=1 Tax=Flavobacterium sp. N1994 TaxID=2986827 RepID=UPI00222246CA|nr:helix-turn-helix domain-containing protein [Flavobacterium sp. N1994]
MDKDELISIRKKLELNQEDFAKLAAVSRRTVQNWESGGVIPETKWNLLRNLLQQEHNKKVNNALNTVNEPREFYTNKNGNKFIELKNGKFKIIVKKVPVKAFASYLSDFQNAHFMDELEEVSFTVDHIGKGKYLCFESEGESMNGGSIDDTPGDAELLCRELGRQHWKDGFRDSQYGWVIVHNQTVIFKDIKSFDKKTGDIVCSSRSGLPNHPDFTINLNDVRQILKVIKRTF